MPTDVFEASYPPVVSHRCLKANNPTRLSGAKCSCCNGASAALSMEHEKEKKTNKKHRELPEEVRPSIIDKHE